MVDSGATHCFISPHIVSQAQLPLQSAPSMIVTLADGTQLTSSHSVDFLLILHDQHMHINARTVDNLSHDIVLGMNWLNAFNPVIDWQSYSITFPSTQLTLSCLPSSKVAPVEVCSLASIASVVDNGAVAWLALLKSTAGVGETSLEAPDKWAQLCDEYKDIFDTPGQPA